MRKILVVNLTSHVQAMTCRPLSSITGWKWFAEGNANALYVNSREYPGRTLRLRKLGAGIYTCKDVYEFHIKNVIPYLDQYALEMELVQIPPELYEELDPKGVTLRREEQYGVLMPVIGGEALSESLVLEFKPKWLDQSPNAPKDSLCCRTCALNMKRGRANAWCPLDLGSGDRKQIQRFAESVVASSLSQVQFHTHDIVSTLADYLMTTNLIERLLNRQRLDDRGVLGCPDTSPLPPQLYEAMTYRDCTVLFEMKLGSVDNWHVIQLDNGAVYSSRAVVVDLDPKAPSKRAHWDAVERSLQPYYTQRAPTCAIST